MSDFLDTGAPIAVDAAPQVDVTQAADLPASSGDIVENAPAPSLDNLPTVETAATTTTDSDDSFDLSNEDIEDAFGISKEKPESKEEIPLEVPLPDDAEKPTESVTETPETDVEIDTAIKSETKVDERVDDWKDADSLKEFRDLYETNKKELISLKKNSFEQLYLVDAAKAAEILKEKSPTQYEALVQIAANEAAVANPAGHIEFYIEHYGDLVAQKLFGDENLTKNRALAERETVDPELFDTWEDTGAPPSLDTPEKLELERLRKMSGEREQSELQFKQQTLEQKIAAPITDTVDRIVRDAGLEVLATDTPRQKAFKEILNTKIFPNYIANELATDQAIAPVFNQVNSFIQKLDEKGATELQFTLANYVEDKAEELASYFTELMAAAETIREMTKAAAPPPKIVAASSGAGGGANGTGSVFSDSFEVGRDEWAAAVRRSKS